jgi:hypothetical protein
LGFSGAEAGEGRAALVSEAEVRLVEERSGKLLAHGSTTCLIIPGG